MRTITRREGPVAENHAPPNGRQTEPEEGPAPEQEPGQLTEPESVPGTTFVEFMIGEVNIVNHYSCHSQQGHGIIETRLTSGAGEGVEMETTSAQGQGAWITISHAAQLSEERWGEGKGRSKQTILQQLEKIRHIASERPPTGGPREILIWRPAFEEFDARMAPRPRPAPNRARAA
jgi:hypothetical protein